MGQFYKWEEWTELKVDFSERLPRNYLLSVLARFCSFSRSSLMAPTVPHIILALTWVLPMVIMLLLEWWWLLFSIAYPFE